MCSTVEARLARIGEAIEELAAAAREGSATGTPGVEDLSARLARVWAMVAELDPGLAERLPGYVSGND